jgi:hypothetical protein
MASCLSVKIEKGQIYVSIARTRLPKNDLMLPVHVLLVLKETKILY